MSEKKFISIVFDREKEKEVVMMLEMIRRISGLSVKEILIEGLNSDKVREEFEKGKKLLNDLS